MTLMNEVFEEHLTRSPDLTHLIFSVVFLKKSSTFLTKLAKMEELKNQIT